MGSGCRARRFEVLLHRSMSLGVVRGDPVRHMSLAIGRSPARAVLVGLIVLGQALAIFLVRGHDAFWPVAIPWFVSLFAALGLCAETLVPAHRWRFWREAKLRAYLPEIALVVGLLVLAGALRIPLLESFPSGIHGDEGEFGTIAAAVAHHHGPAPFGVAFLGDPALYLYVVAPFVAALGSTMEAIRLPSALFGTVTIPFLYFQVRDLFGRRAAVIATFLLATSTVHIHFSRLAINVIEVPLFASLSLWLLARGISQRDDRWYVLAGMAGGLGLYFHFGARMIPLILVLVLLGQFAFERSDWRRWLRGTVLTGIGGLLALSPMITHVIGNPEEFVGHMAERGIWHHWGDLAKLFHTVPSNKAGILWWQTQRTFEAFFSRPDPGYGAFFYTFMNAPLLGYILSFCALAGLAGLLLRPRDMRARLIVIWFIIPIIFASILTDTAGQAHRLIHPLVPAIIAAAVAIDQVSQFVWRRLPRRVAPWVALPVLVVPIFSGLPTTVHYFDSSVTQGLNAPETAQARCMEGLPPGTIALVVGKPYASSNFGPSRFLAPTVDRRDLKDPTIDLPVQTDGHGLVILVHEWNLDLIPMIRAYYPDAPSIEINRPPGTRALTVLAIPAPGQSATALLDDCRANESQ